MRGTDEGDGRRDDRPTSYYLQKRKDAKSYKAGMPRGLHTFICHAARMCRVGAENQWLKHEKLQTLFLYAKNFAFFVIFASLRLNIHAIRNAQTMSVQAAQLGPRLSTVLAPVAVALAAARRWVLLWRRGCRLPMWSRDC